MTRTALLLFVVAAGCSKQIPRTPTPEERAQSAFWDALLDGSYDRLPEATRALEAVHATRPGDFDTTFLLGHAYLWRIAEIGRGGPPDPAVAIPIAGMTMRYLSEAAALRPEDHRIPGWMGPVRLGGARARGDAALAQQAIDYVRHAADENPVFNLFPLAVMLAGFPPGSPELAQAVDTVWARIDACLATPIDRRHPAIPDLGPLVADTPQNRRCWRNGAHWPHRWEGFWITMGDILAKGGDPVAARTLYENARLTPAYLSWSERPLLEERIASVEQRVGLYRDGNPANDPTLLAQGPHQCVMCHAR